MIDEKTATDVILEGFLLATHSSDIFKALLKIPSENLRDMQAMIEDILSHRKPCLIGNEND